MTTSKPAYRTAGIRAPRSLLLAIGCAFLTAVLLQLTAGAGHAQPSGSSWSKPVLLFQSSDSILYPDITVDEEGGVHVFWQLERASGNSAQSSQRMIYYTREVNGRWSRPSDVVASQSASLPTAAVDHFGTIHLFWNGEGSAEFTASAPVNAAVLAGAWSEPTFVGNGNGNAQVVADGTGRLHLVYPGSGASGVVYQTSVDGGATWSFPVTVATTAGAKQSANFTRLAVGPDGTIHVVWTEFELPNGWPPTGVYYSHSIDGGKTWSNPIQIAGPGFDQANVAAGSNGLVHVAWNGMSGIQWRYDRWSSDNGKAWSKAVVLKTPGLGGSEGPPQLAVDESGMVHLVTTDGNRVWYAFWKDGQWSRPQYVPSGNEAGIPPGDTPVDAKTRHIEQAVMALSQGRRLNVVFWDERDRQNRTDVWYTSKDLSAPATAPTPFSTPSPAVATRPTLVASAVPSPSVSPQKRADSEASFTPAGSATDSNWAIAPGVAAAILLVGGVALGTIRYVKVR